MDMGATLSTQRVLAAILDQKEKNVSEETNDLATLLRLAQAIAQHRDTETLCIAYDPMEKKWGCNQRSGDQKIENLRPTAKYATATEPLNAFITAKRP
jgi:hypothetical protein